VPGVVIIPDGFDGFDSNYCHGKPDGVFCKALSRNDAELHFFQLGERPMNEYGHGECCKNIV